MTSETLTTRDGLVGNSPRYIGGISPAYQRYLKDDAGAAINLTGVPTANLAIVFVNQSNPTIVNVGTGTFSIPSGTASQGLMVYQYGASDLLSGGNWYLFVTCQLIGEPAPRVFDPELLTVESQPFSDSGSSPIVTIQSINLTEVNGAPVSGSNAVPTESVDGAHITLGTTTDASSVTSVIGLLKAIKAYLAGTLTVTANPPTSATSTVTSVPGAVSDTSLIAANASRKGILFYNDSTAILYLLFGTGVASASNYTVQIPAQGFFEVPVSPVYTGGFHGIWAAANGSVKITELT